MPETKLSFTQPGFTGRIGVARTDITPEPDFPIRNWGAAKHLLAAGIHRPLTATALTLQQTPNDAPLVFLTLDLGWWLSSKDEWHVRGYLLEALDLDPARLMLSLTHTHAGPSLWRGDTEGDNSSRVAAYLDALREKLKRCVQTALATADVATLDWDTGQCALAQNRDLRDPDAARYLLGYNAGGPADQTLLVGRVTGLQGEIRAILVHYACHPTTLAWENRLLSPDYVGALRAIVEAWSDGALCLFMQGVCGELAPREQFTADTAIADAHGKQLGYAVLAVLEGMLPPQTALQYTGVVESGAPLAVWKRTVNLPETRLTAAKIEVELPLKTLPTCEELDAQRQACTDPAQSARLLRKRLIREGIGNGTTTQMPLWIWFLGNIVFVGHPNEAYSALQTELRQQFPHFTVVTMNVVNGHYGYLPPAACYTEDLYSVWQTPFAPGGLEKLIEICAATLQSSVAESA